MTGRGLRRCLSAGATAALASMLVLAGPAQATYPGKNGDLAWEAYQAQQGTEFSPSTATDKLETASAVLTTCDDPTGVPPCQLGAPNYSPDGQTVVVSRRTPTDVLNDKGDNGALMLVDAGGGNERVLPRFTSDDEDPAFLPSGNTLVFDGRSSATARPDLYTVTTAGTGLGRVLMNASQPAPCANGSIVFVRNKDLYLLSRSRQSVKRLTFRGGADPSCAPNSQRVAFIRGNVLYTLGTNGKQLKRITGAHNGVSYSPDGRSIAFIWSHDLARGSALDVDAADAQGRHHRVLKSDIAQNWFGDEDPEQLGFAAGTAWQPQR